MLFLILVNFFNEIIDYDLYLGFLKVGSLKLTCKKTFYQNIEVYQFSCYLSSSPHSLFPIADTIISYATFDFKTLFSYKSINEKNFKDKDSIYFDYQNNKIVYDNKTFFPLINDIKDILTFWFYIRKIIAGKEMVNNCFLHYNKKNYEVMIEKKKRIFVNTKIGSFYAWELMPCTRPKAKILGSIYIQEGENYLPLIIKTNFLGGLLKAVIKSYEKRF
jgi:hypothetical protein